MSMVRSSLLYLLDANVPIDANRDYYPIERVPEFWDWLIEMGRSGNVKIPIEIYEEIVVPRPTRRDALVEFLIENRGALVLGEEPDPELVDAVTVVGYGDDLTDVDLEKIGRDPFLIAYALADTAARRVVSNENSRPSQIGANRKIPDVCNQMGVTCLRAFDFFRELDFRTNWRSVD